MDATQIWSMGINQMKELGNSIIIYILNNPIKGHYFSLVKDVEWIIWEMMATELDLNIIQNCRAEYQKQYIYWTWKVNFYSMAN